MHRRRADEKRKGFTEPDYARLLDAAHQQLAGPSVLIWDNLNAHVSGMMADLVESVFTHYAHEAAAGLF